MAQREPNRRVSVDYLEPSLCGSPVQTHVSARHGLARPLSQSEHSCSQLDHSRRNSSAVDIPIQGP